MGRPYQSELRELAGTFRWASGLDASDLSERVRALADSSLLAIGSGGSQSIAQLIADLHQWRFGQMSRAETPLIATGHVRRLKSSATILVSARGNNPDILGVARTAVEAEPRSLIALCASRGSPLARIVTGFCKGFCFEFELPTGRDGFLATNSLLALGTVALGAYGYDRNYVLSDLESLFSPPGLSRSISVQSVNACRLFDCKYLVVLYGPESRSAALDLESKLVEAGLISVQVTDYRNFAHGRHHWLAKNPDTGVVALASKNEQDLAARTLALLPPQINTQLLKTDLSGAAAWLALQAVVFAFVAEFGAARKIDPGRPGVPAFGRRIYHLNAFKQQKPDTKVTALARKLNASTGTSEQQIDILKRAYAEFCARFRKARFHGIVLDYDGTICDPINRFGGIPYETAEALERILSAGFELGIATGRGRSVRETLHQAFAEKYWSQVWVGYYNGGRLARLDAPNEPDTSGPVDPRIQLAADTLKRKAPGLELSVRPSQITVEWGIQVDVGAIWHRVLQVLQESNIRDIKVVASSRSVDIIRSETSKLALVKLLTSLRKGTQVLCIGDRPRWPGNDFELLGHEFGLSVDEVDGRPETTWNLAPAGVLGSSALRYYLARIQIRKRYFTIGLQKK